MLRFAELLKLLKLLLQLSELLLYLVVAMGTLEQRAKDIYCASLDHVLVGLIIAKYKGQGFPEISVDWPEYNTFS